MVSCSTFDKKPFVVSGGGFSHAVAIEMWAVSLRQRQLTGFSKKDQRDGRRKVSRVAMAICC